MLVFSQIELAIPEGRMFLRQAVLFVVSPKRCYPTDLPKQPPTLSLSYLLKWVRDLRTVAVFHPPTRQSMFERGGAQVGRV
jgi:hypothetical protein